MECEGIMDSLFIVIPAYNEQDNIENVIKDWYPIVEKYNGDGRSRLVIIDDGSKDETYAIMQKYAKDCPLFQPLTKTNSGHGATVLYGYHYALDNKADFVFQTDSDGQTVPAEFHQFWEQRHQYDMVIGHRCKREDGLSRIFVTKVLKLVIKICFKAEVTDANTPYRLMESHQLSQNLSYIPEDFNLSNVLLAVIYSKKNQKVKYNPITFKPRQGGVNSINLKKITKIGIQAVKDFKSINRMLDSLNEKEEEECR